MINESEVRAFVALWRPLVERDGCYLLGADFERDLIRLARLIDDEARQVGSRTLAGKTQCYACDSEAVGLNEHAVGHDDPRPACELHTTNRAAVAPVPAVPAVQVAAPPKCYACDQPSTGVKTTRGYLGGMSDHEEKTFVKAACDRHRDGFGGAK